MIIGTLVKEDCQIGDDAKETVMFCPKLKNLKGLGVHMTKVKQLIIPGILSTL